MRYFWGSLVLLWGLNVGVLYLVRQSDPPRPDPFLATEGCPLPCWVNLRPGVHTTDTFWVVLNHVKNTGGWMYDGYPSTLDMEGGILSEFKLTITPSQTIRLGDVLLLYGKPDYARILQGATLSRSTGGRQQIAEVYLYWADGYVQVVATPANLEDDPSGIAPQMWLREITMRDPASGEPPLYVDDLERWRGFSVAEYYATP